MYLPDIQVALPLWLLSVPKMSRKERKKGKREKEREREWPRWFEKCVSAKTTEVNKWAADP